MEGERKFFLSMWAMIFSTICVIVIIFASYQYSVNEQIVNMVKAGADPIAASCSLSDNDASRCAIAATRKAAP